MTMQPLAFFRDYISTWEGGLSLDKDDSGNWLTVKGHAPVLVGSNFGVTGAALAKFRGKASVTADDMKHLTLDEAVQIAQKLYYDVPNFDLLPWDAVIASCVDFGWGAGPIQSAMLLQRLIGVADDGQIGPYTVRAYGQWVASHGEENCALLWQSTRDGFYHRLVQTRPVLGKYLKGWMRRSAYFAPHMPWWTRFHA